MSRWVRALGAFIAGFAVTVGVFGYIALVGSLSVPVNWTAWLSLVLLMGPIVGGVLASIAWLDAPR